MTSDKDIKQSEIPCSPCLSQGFEQLAQQLETDTEDPVIDFDVVIIGSGYGAAIAASQLAGQRHPNGDALSLCILERGKEYLPGMFPSREADLSGHLRFSKSGDETPSGRREGLFDIRMGQDINVVLANGLGGGSLINAGVMETPAAEVFNQSWPKAINSHQLQHFYQRAKALVGGSHGQVDNTIEAHPEHQQTPLEKYQSLQHFSRNNIAQGEFRPATITVAMRTAFNDEGLLLKQCTLCGDCATGCNHGAKQSLDVNLLARAERLGTAIYTGATVLSVEAVKPGGTWQLDVTYTDKVLRQRQGHYRPLRATKVILAAGTLGSTEILQRSQNEKGLALSKKLGAQFSGNGDSISTGYQQTPPANSVARETEPANSRRVGPSITGIIDLTQTPDAPFIIEELAVPGPLRRLFEELTTTAKTLHELDSFDGSKHRSAQPGNDPFAVNPAAINHSSLYAVMARDNAGGKLSLPPLKPGQQACEGTIHIDGSPLKQDPVFKRQLSWLETMTERSKIGGRIIANPLWKLLPESMASLINNQDGPLVSVHPLGGCPMGDNVKLGVVDHLGRVFDASASSAEFHDGLVVLDGSIIPAALGTNPALSIAALSLRAIEQLSEQWQLQAPEQVEPPNQRQRRITRDCSQPDASKTTEVELSERLSGEITLQTKSGEAKNYIAELTLCFEPKALSELTQLDDSGRTLNRRFTIPETPLGTVQTSTLHIYRPEVWRQLQDSNATERLSRESWDQQADLLLPVAGTLELFSRKKSWAPLRTLKALWAYWLNRGMRDTYQHYREPGKNKGPGIGSRICSSLKLASRAGETRLFSYRLTLADSAKPGLNTELDTQAFSRGQPIRAHKQIRYHRRANPWQQLMQAEILVFPGLRKYPGQQLLAKLPFLRLSPPILALDTNYLVGNGIPLIRIAKQQDEPTALADLASLAAYTLRMLVSIHLWTFRKPDRSISRAVNRLPGEITDLPYPTRYTEAVDQIAGKDINIRLTHYPQPHSQQAPVLLIHGYSASGSTYTHPAIKPNLAQQLYRAGRDVWVLDLRSSIGWDGSNGYPATANLAWTFEDIAFTDIPFAVDFLLEKTDCDKVDIVAHCMGAAMVSMAILSDGAVTKDQIYRQQLGGGLRRAYPEALAALPSRINKLVLSQVGPAIIFSPANVLRAYMMSFMRHYLPSDKYSFNPELDPVTELKTDDTTGELAGQLLDRLLYSLPYPDEDYDIENPLCPTARTVFTKTRHRMDALYGRTFSLKNLSNELLEHIDDIFGPLNITTLSQIIHFTKYKTLSNYIGNNEFVSRSKLRQYWTFPTLHIHGGDNGLADPQTSLRMAHQLKAADVQLESYIMKGFGHQDSLIGTGATEAFDKIEQFLSKPVAQPTAPVNAIEKKFFALPPWSGPVVDMPLTEKIPVRLGANPALDDPVLLCFIPVKRVTDQAGEEFCVISQNRCSTKKTLIDDIVKSVEIFPLDDNNDRWHKLDIPCLLSRETLADGVLALFLYHDSRECQQPIASGDLSKPILRQQVAEAIATALHADNRQQLATGLLEYRRQQQSDQLHLAFASCQYPAGILYNMLAYSSWRRFSDMLQDKPQAQPDLLLLLGDQIYSDPTAGLFDPKSKQDLFDHPYQQWLHHPDVRSVLRRLPSCMMLDDHELRDNWVRDSGEADNDWLLQQGRSAYVRYQRHEQLHADAPLWRSFSKQGFAFFMSDTRTERELRKASTVGGKNIISPQQFSALGNWIKANNNADGRPAFISSSAILLPRHIRAIADNNASSICSDSWDGYPKSLHRLLALIADEQINNIIFLSGDEHLAVVAQIHIRNLDTGKQAVTHSIHSSSLHAPFPFANGLAEQLQAEDLFIFDYQSDSTQQLNHYECRISNKLAISGDGFTFLKVAKSDGQWQLQCRFDREEKSDSVTTTITLL